MRLPKRRTVIKYGSTIAVGALLGWMYLAVQKSEYGPFADRTSLDQLRLLCDAFTIPGLLLLLSGLLITVTNEGSLDGVRYLGHYLYHMFIPGKRGSTQRYADFVVDKRAKRVTGYSFLYIVAGMFMAAALVFYALYKIHS